MHRTGTSVLMRLLEALGCHTGEESDFHPPTPHDRDGYRERIDVWSINEDALTLLGAAWDRPLGAQVERLAPAERAAFERRAAAVVERLDRHQPWVIKDPRLCLLSGLWWPALPDAVSILTLRHPVEVARSLQSRDALPLHIGIALWEVYTRAAVAALAGRPWVRMRYEDLVRDAPVAIAGLVRDLEPWGRLDSGAEEAVAGLFASDRRRQQATARDVEDWLSPAQAALWRALEAPTLELESIAAEVSPLAREVLGAHERSSTLALSHERRDAEISGWNQSLTVEVDRLSAEVRQLTLDVERWAAEAGRSSAELEQEKASAEAAREAAITRTTELGMLAERLAALAEQYDLTAFDWRWRARRAMRQELERLTARLERHLLGAPRPAA